MEFSYTLSEKAAPFLLNCDIDDPEVCQAFEKEVNKQWELILSQNRGEMITEKDAENNAKTELAERVQFYLKCYRDYNMNKDSEELDFDQFMESAYELSEKAEPFLEMCALDD